MKILYHHRIGSKDGQYVHVEELVEALRRLGHLVEIVGPEAIRRERFGYDSGPIARLKRWTPRAVYELLELLYSWVDYRRLVRVAARFEPDCLYERFNLFLPSGVWLKRKTGLPMLLEVNAPLWEERSRYSGIALNRVARWSQHYAWRGADVVLPVTGVLARYVREAGVPEERVRVIPNGVDQERFRGAPDRGEAKQRLGLQGRTVLGFTGFVREWHRLERAVELIARGAVGPNGHLLVVGDGPARPELERSAARFGIADRVTITGVVERDRVADHVAAFDVALQPAVVPYASPLKLFEYLAVGRAVVAPATENILEVLTDGRNALLFDPDRPGAFEEAVVRAATDARLRSSLEHGARTLIEERGLTWVRNAERVARLAEDLEPAHGKGRPRQ